MTYPRRAVDLHGGSDFGTSIGRGLARLALALGLVFGVAPAAQGVSQDEPVVNVVGDSITAGRIGREGTGIGDAVEAIDRNARTVANPRALPGVRALHLQPVTGGAIPLRGVVSDPQPDVVVVMAGLNDLAHLTDYQLVQWGAERGVEVLVSTITLMRPIWPWRAAMEPQRQRVNDWLRTRTWSLDLAASLELARGMLMPRYDCGDGLHPNVRGSWLVARGSWHGR
jgi:lysophospholipase L1-like esterase